MFQLKGIGTVATGVPVSGAIEAGDTIELLPGGNKAKVRAVQAFGGKVGRAVAGHSTALSVPDAREARLRPPTAALHCAARKGEEVPPMRGSVAVAIVAIVAFAGGWWLAPGGTLILHR